MDPITQNVNENIEEYINGLVAECLQAPGLSSLPLDQKEEFSKQLEEYFYQTAFEVTVEKMTGEQFSQIENLEPGSPEMIEKVQVLAAQVPGLADDLEKKLQEDVAYIKQNSNIPAT